MDDGGNKPGTVSGLCRISRFPGSERFAICKITTFHCNVYEKEREALITYGMATDKYTLILRKVFVLAAASTVTT